MRSPLDLLLTERTLHRVRSICDGDLPDSIIDQVMPDSSPIIKNMCAKVSVQLVDRLDSTCQLLDVSKRKFIETAVIEALDKADQIMGSEGVWEAFEEDRKRLELAELGKKTASENISLEVK
jgi:hypothetical protein